MVTGRYYNSSVSIPERQLEVRHRWEWHLMHPCTLRVELL